MFGDQDHIKRLKEQEAWPEEYPLDARTPKALKAAEKADRAALKAAEKAGRNLVKQSKRVAEAGRPAKKSGRGGASTHSTAGEIADIKAAAWQAKQEQRAMKEKQAAQKGLLKAEKAAARTARWQADEERRWEQEMAAARKEARRYGGAVPTYDYYEPTAYQSRPGGGNVGGCGGTVALLLLFILVLMLLWCGRFAS